MEIPARRGVVSLTYDGLLPSHVEVAIPALDAAGLKGTFFGDGAGFAADLGFWRGVAESGHELGNGALIALAGQIDRMTAEGLLEEIRETDELLAEMNGVSSMAWPIGSPTASQPNFDFVHAAVVRTGLEGVNRDIDLRRLKCVPALDLSGEEMIDIACWALERGWVIFAFEGIGDGERAVDRDAHQALINWLIEQKMRVVTVAEGARVSKRAAEDV